PRTKQLPATNLTQVTAQNSCAQSSGIVLTGINSATFTKRLLRRSEHLAASSWPASLSSLQIESLKSGSTASDLCNGNGSNVEMIGNNADCVSLYGIYDMAGNAWELVSDRLNSRVGVSQDDMRLDKNNKDMDGYSLAEFANNYLGN